MSRIRVLRGRLALLCGFAVGQLLAAACSSSEEEPEERVAEVPSIEAPVSSVDPDVSPLACPEGFADCDGDHSNGCEVDLATSRAHCGGCGRVCNWACSEGICNDPVQLSLGVFGGCAALGDGHAACWGLNYNGQVGDGTGGTLDDRRLPEGERTSVFPPATISPAFEPRPVFVKTSENSRIAGVVMVSRGLHHACALTDAGEVYCWGANYSGQLGDGSLLPRGFAGLVRSPAEGFFTGPALSDVIQISTGWYHSCAVVRSGRVYCWGRNLWGRLGNGVATFENVVTPVPMVGISASDPILSEGVEVSAGLNATCVRRTQGIVCAGRDHNGARGDGGENGLISARPTRVRSVDDYAVWTQPTRQIQASVESSCALQDDGRVACWGGRPFGNGDEVLRAAPKLVLDTTGRGILSNIQQISGVDSHMCGLDSAGFAFCWGWNGYGQLGNVGALPDSRGEETTLPVALLNPETTSPQGGILEVSAGGRHTCTRMQDGRVLCWGQNSYGELGNGGTSEAAYGVEVLPPLD